MSNISVSDTSANPAHAELWARRFLGLEIYHVDKAEWNLYRDSERGKMNLWIKLVCDRAIQQFEDTKFTCVIPSWELNLVESSIEITNGFEAAIPTSYDESREGWITNFYANHHEGTDNNVIQVIEQEGDRLLMRITGETIDLNFYDDSKPRTQLAVETWFVKNDQGSRSMQ